MAEGTVRHRALRDRLCADNDVIVAKTTARQKQVADVTDRQRVAASGHGQTLNRDVARNLTDPGRPDDAHLAPLAAAREIRDRDVVRRWSQPEAIPRTALLSTRRVTVVRHRRRLDDEQRESGAGGTDVGDRAVLLDAPGETVVAVELVQLEILDDIPSVVEGRRRLCTLGTCVVDREVVRAAEDAGAQKARVV